jgi:cytochrome d ubiquinol oxidase subunit I
MESMWETENPPAAFTLFGLPDQEAKTTHFAIHIPYVMGIIGTRSLDKPLAGLNELVEAAKPRIQDGAKAYDALQTLKHEPQNAEARATLKQYQDHLGYGFLLLAFTPDPLHATPEQMNQAAESLIPQVTPLFWAFRLMVACGFFFIFLFTAGFILSAKRQLYKRWFLKLSLISLPLPWIAIELGWFVAEYGRQPWAVDRMLPTFMGVSSLTTTELLFSLFGFALLYTLFAIIEVNIMMRAIQKGPETPEAPHAY